MNETENNIIMKRFTKQQIKLVYRNSAGQYVVYPLSNNRQKRIFDTQSAMLRYYSNDTIFVSIITSKIFASNNHNDLVGRRVVLRITYTKYKALNGAIISNIDITRNEMVLILQQNGDIYPMIKSVINKMRRDRGITVLFDLTLTNDRYSENVGDYVINNPLDETLCDTTDATITQTTRVSEIEQIRDDLIHSYHSRNRLEFKNTTGNEKHSHRYFGIELEIDSNGCGNNRNKLATRLNNILNRGNEYKNVKFERDGSLSSNGFEIITQPMTYEFIKENGNTIKEALNMIDELGYSSHDNGVCGLHIHISRTEIPDDVLTRICQIFENFKNELIVFSRRTQNGMRWCRFITDLTSTNILTKEYIDTFKDSYGMKCHGVVINNANDNTVEFRLFRGTTKYNTLMASIQLIDNIINIARDKTEVENISWKDIINYNEKYQELIKYNEKRNIISQHMITSELNRNEVNNRGVVLVRPFQVTIEGDN